MTSVLTMLAASPPTNVVQWFTKRSFRTRSGAIPSQVWLTVWHSGAALLLAVCIAVPLAVVLAHHRRGELIAGWVVNTGRAIPTVAILGVAVIVSLREGLGFEPWPIILSLVLLALPPLFANTYTAVRGVDPSAVDAARAVGLSERAIMARIELPLALPVLFVGLRTAAVQVVATEPIAALFGAEGLGAYIRQGLGNNDLYQIQAGALMVTGVAIVADLLLWLVSRTVIPAPVRRQTARSVRRSRRSPTIAEATA
ncbi:MAG: ABC transporter permease [Actinomycetota bacterium]|nr:ABC transporter permease [Actinomycetota bacterium]